ncbi:MAG TPA: hypothetical protein VGQ09_07435 [Chitinophagaceae bacterium]|nr:hypothetical protein [Chitinophagaceae bacterium]
MTIQTKHQVDFMFNIISCLLIVTSLIIFFTLIFPVNRTTQNWTLLPDNWQQLRKRWEFSHATSAVLYFTALLMLIIPLVKKE